MKTKAILFSIIGLLFSGFGAYSQLVNQLSIPVVDGKLGQEALVPVYMTNDAEITGVQVSIHFPQGAQVNTQGVALTDRKDNHTISVNSRGNNDYLFIIFSASNKLIKGNSGILFTIPVKVPMSWLEGTSYPFAFNQVILSAVNGDNLATTSDPGAIRVVAEPRPDFTVDNIRTDKSSVAPGDKFIASWTVKNSGDKATAVGWSERITLVDDNDKQTFLGTLYQSGVIPGGGSVNRQAEFALSQLPGIEGNVKLSVQIIPDPNSGELPGAQGNNTAKSAQYITITKKLLLESPAYALPENNSALVQCKLSRSGDWSQQQVFSLSASDPSRISIPASVTIPAQQSGAFFYITVLNDGILDADSVVTISAQGNGYETVTNRVVIEDANLPALTLTASKTEITQGETFTITIERARVSSSDLSVNLSCNFPKKFNLPASVTIPANQKSVNVNVTAINDGLPDITRSVEFTASAVKYSPAKLSLTLNNNNLPQIELTLTPQAVSKSAGLLAIKAVLRRLTLTNNVVTIQLSDNSGGRLYYANPTITLQAGVQEVQFTIGVVDNDLVDGDKTFNVTAAVYVSSCGCTISGTSAAGTVTVPVTILDTNSPALKIVSSQPMLPEGKTNAGVLTIKRNTPPTDNLTVTISSDHDDELTYNKTVTIPAGSVSVDVPVSVLPNNTGVSKGDRTVTFTVTATGYTKGTCWAMISDQTLPDAVISSITLSNTVLKAADSTNVQIVVKNAGAAPLQARIPVNFYLSNGSSVLATSYTTKVLGINETETLTKNMALPDVTGNYTLYATLNENQAVKELLYLNNSSDKIPVTLLPKFTATAATDKKVYKQGEAVTITGQLTGSAIANAALEVYLINSGVRQTLNATTDASGKYSLIFRPSVFQSGHFSVGACYPNEGLTTEKAAFDIYGIKREGTGNITNDLLINEPYKGTINLTNTGTLVLTNLRAEVVSPIDNATLVVDPISSIAGNATATLKYTLTGNTPSNGSEWQQIKLKLVSAESDLMDLTLYVYFRTPQGKLQADISYIRTTMTKGASRDYPFTITNMGKGVTGKISLSLPANATWLSTGTPREMASLAPNESATVVLRFTPSNDLPLNIPITGSIGVNCEIGTGFPLSFSIEPVSESTGTLVIDVCDEYTYYTAEAPHLAGAKVIVKHPATGAVIAQGVTDAKGLFTMPNLPEGYYALDVTADKHDRYQYNILVDPGKTTTKVVNLSFQAITIDWNVVETTVQDEYNITTTIKYETNVPVPVVVTEMPDSLPVNELLNKGYYMFNVVLTNKGLITTHDVNLTFSEDPALLFEYPALDNFSLRPQESIIIPVKVSVIGAEQSSSRLRSTTGITLPCRVSSFTTYAWDCGEDRKWHQYPLTIKVITCPGIPGISGIGGGGGSGCGGCWGLGGPAGGGSSGGYNGSSGGSTPPGINNTGCEPCQNRFLFKMVKCGLKRIPIIQFVTELIDKWECVQEIVEDGKIGCVWKLVKVPKLVEKIIGYKDIWEECIKPLFEKCVPGDFGSSPFPNSPVLRASTDYPNYIQAYQESLKHADNEAQAGYVMFMDLFGDEAWLFADPDELSAFAGQMENITGIIDAGSSLHSYKPAAITEEQYAKFVERWNNTVNNVTASTNRIDKQILNQQAQLIIDAREYSATLGYPSVTDMISEEENKVMEKLDNASSSVCASITLQFSQTMTMTRQAFRGTLTVFNGNETTAMTNVNLNLVVKDEAGNVMTSHEFQINNESLNGFSGDLNGIWSLDAQKTGVATIVFIPTKYAAPTVPVNYSFGGTLTYVDPFTGLVVTRDLYPVTLTVKPSPNLDLTYFMQRDVLGDDPLTPAIEPIVPGEFSLLINNVGEGEAANVIMVTQQPKIVDNQKGLFINFELLSSQLNGGDYTLALGGSVPTDFGNIPAGKTTYAQWWFTGSLLGHFTQYDINATHVTGFGNPDLSLLNKVTIHELIHSIRTPDGKGSFLTGFVVNDIADADDLPDRIYLSDGTIEPVACTTNIQCTSTGNVQQYQLTVSPAAEGWNYGCINDPTGGNQQLLEIKRLSDNAVINLRNFWQTDRTLRDGKDPLYENKLHWVDKIGTGNEQYLLTFSPRPYLFLDVESFAGAPTTLALAPVTEITVRFNKNIIASTFTGDDIRLICQGAGVDAGLIKIIPVDEKTFKLDLSKATESDGYYVLTVQTSGITDYEGFQGKTGKTADWNQYMGGQMQFNLKIDPEAGGTVSIPSGKYDFGSVLNLRATPNEGYDFDRWSINGETLSTDTVYKFTLISSQTLTASFKLKLYDVAVNYDSIGGNVSGGGTGKYEYGSRLVLRAMPAAGYEFTAWKIAGVYKDNAATLEITVKSGVTIEAIFSPKVVETTLEWDWHAGGYWISMNLRETINPTTFFGPVKQYFIRLLSQTGELIYDPKYEFVGNITELDPRLGYKLQMKADVTKEQYGTAALPENYVISLHKGWTWIGYPLSLSLELPVVLSKLNAESGDVIKSQTDFSIFDGNNWTGTLTTLYPGEGYIYYSRSDKSLEYSSVKAPKAVSKVRSAMSAAYEQPWQFNPHKYLDNMSMISRLFLDGKITPDNTYTVGAFCGDECRGIGKYVSGYLFITIHGEKKGDVITFKAIENQSQKEVKINETVAFDEVVLGTLNEPYPLNISKNTGLDNPQAGFGIYPNPVKDKLYIKGDISKIKMLLITNPVGGIVMKMNDLKDNAVRVSHLAPGVYLVSIRTENEAVIYKFIKDPK